MIPIANPTFLQFDEWASKRLLPSSAWISEPGIRIYIRKGWLATHGDYVLANMEARKPGKGALTAFLDRWEPHYRFSIENVINPRLIPYFERRGYTSVNWKGFRCMLGPTVPEARARSFDDLGSV